MEWHLLGIIYCSRVNVFHILLWDVTIFAVFREKIKNG